MRHNLTRYIGRVIRMTYIDGEGRITDRRVRVRTVDAERGMMKAFCLSRRAPRLFKLDNILAVQAASSGKWAG
jgi:predicted DNA-binding transcriptional regulator YafY